MARVTLTADHLVGLEYGNRAFWKAVLAAPDAVPDSAGRACVVVGAGVAGVIRSTRAYAEDQLWLLRRRRAA